MLWIANLDIFFRILLFVVIHDNHGVYSVVAIDMKDKVVKLVQSVPTKSENIAQIKLCLMEFLKESWQLTKGTRFDHEQWRWEEYPVGVPCLHVSMSSTSKASIETCNWSLFSMLSNIESLMNDREAFAREQVPYEATTQWYLGVRRRYELSIMQLGLHKVGDEVQINAPPNWIDLQNKDIDSSSSAARTDTDDDTDEGRNDTGIRTCTDQPNPRPNPQPNPQYVGYHNTLVEGKQFLAIQTLSYGTICVTTTGKTKYGLANTKLKFMLRSPPRSQYGLDIFTATNDSASPGRHWALDITPTADFIGSPKGSASGGFKGPDFANLVTFMNTVIQFLLDMKHYSGLRLYDREYVMFRCERVDYSIRAVKSLLVNDVQKKFTCPVDNKAPFMDVVYLPLIAEEVEKVILPGL